MSRASERFGEIAENYAKSKVHVSGKSLHVLYSYLTDASNLKIADVGCATGNCAKFLMQKAEEIVGFDPSAKMLKQFDLNFNTVDIKNQSVQSYAEELKWQDDYFDLVVSRIAAHHFQDIKGGLNEMLRILKPGGYLCIIDLMGFDDAEQHVTNHIIELLHDPTHITSYPMSFWESFFADNEIDILESTKNINEIDNYITIRQWCNIANSGDKNFEAINQLLEVVDQELINSLGIIKKDGIYVRKLQTNLILGKKKK